LRFITTLHNRRGDPLLLLTFLKALSREGKLGSIGVAWSVPSGNPEPSWEELVQEERRVQETLRFCVQMVHNSELSWDAKSFLGRCYRSFQYEFMVSLNLKRRDRSLRMLLFDDPKVREVRYREIGNSEAFLNEIATYPRSQQAEVLRSRYEGFRAGYERMDIYAEMILHPKSALLEIPVEMSEFEKTRADYMAKVLNKRNVEVVLLRLVHCLTNPPQELKNLGIAQTEALTTRLSVSPMETSKLSELERIVGPLPSRD
jgi:hypothetical protein